MRRRNASAFLRAGEWQPPPSADRPEIPLAVCAQPQRGPVVTRQTRSDVADADAERAIGELPTAAAVADRGHYCLHVPVGQMLVDWQGEHRPSQTLGIRQRDSRGPCEVFPHQGHLVHRGPEVGSMPLRRRADLRSSRVTPSSGTRDQDPVAIEPLTLPVSTNLGAGPLCRRGVPRSTEQRRYPASYHRRAGARSCGSIRPSARIAPISGTPPPWRSLSGVPQVF